MACHTYLPWTLSKFAQGVEVKNLGKANGRAMQLVRFQPGALFPAHLHTDVEFLFVLEGEVIQNGHRLHAGCSTVAPAGYVRHPVHQPIRLHVPVSVCIEH
jgi:quercetin dioxygenase-like cupin family protein